jgi:hypothetical protein
VNIGENEKMIIYPSGHFLHEQPFLGAQSMPKIGSSLEQIQSQVKLVLIPNLH